MIVVRIGAKDETVDEARVALVVPTRAGATVDVAYPDGRKRSYVSDGTPRRHYRKAADGRLLVWGRASVTDDEAAEDAALLVGVDDDCDGWRDVTTRAKGER